MYPDEWFVFDGTEIFECEEDARAHAQQRKTAYFLLRKVEDFSSEK